MTKSAEFKNYLFAWKKELRRSIYNVLRTFDPAPIPLIPLHLITGNPTFLSVYLKPQLASKAPSTPTTRLAN